MKRIFLYLSLTMLFFSCGQSKSSADVNTSTFYLIRHAEKDRSDKNDRDPHLKQAGKTRAQNWAKHFNDIKFDKVYSTDYNRTKETATPTAEANNLTLQIYNPSTIDAAQFLEDNKGKTVLIVGHSNTTPMLANALLDKNEYENFDDSDNSNLIVISVDKDGNKTSTISKVN